MVIEGHHECGLGHRSPDMGSPPVDALLLPMALVLLPCLGAGSSVAGRLVAPGFHSGPRHGSRDKGDPVLHPWPLCFPV